MSTAAVRGTGQSKRRVKLSQIVTVRAAVSERGLAAGVGIKACHGGRLERQLASEPAREMVRQYLANQIEESLTSARICDGVDGEAIEKAIDDFVSCVGAGDGDVITRKIAEGEAPTPGKPARLRYVLNPDDLAMHDVLDVPPSSKRKWIHMVNEGETLVELMPPEPGSPGRTVQGEAIECDAEHEDESLDGVGGSNTHIEGNRLLAGCDGACEENATGRVRVVPELVVDAVNQETGSLPQEGMAKSNLLVRKVVESGFRVATTGDVIVGDATGQGTVDDSKVTASNIIVGGTIFGAKDSGESPDRSGLAASEICVAREIIGRQIVAGQILVADSSRFARLEADESIRIDGDAVGGQLFVRRELAVAGDLGSEGGGSRTTVIVSAKGAQSRRKRRRAAAVHSLQERREELQSTVERMDKLSGRRAESDPFWAALLQGEERPAKTPVEATILRKFKDWSNGRKEAERSLEQVKGGLAELAGEAKDEQEVEELGVRIEVGGTIHMDVEFECVVKAEEEDVERQVDFAVEGKRCRNHMLDDIRSELRRRADLFTEGQASQIKERKQALDQMFEGAAHKPSGPEVATERFEMPFEWSGDGEESGDEALRVEHTAYLDSSDESELFVRTVARAREKMAETTLSVAQEGCRVTMSPVETQPGEGKWQQCREILETLSGIRVGGICATDLFVGQQADDESSTNEQQEESDVGSESTGGR